MKWNEWCFRSHFCTVRLYWTRTIWVNDMNFVMNHAPGAGLITWPVDLCPSRYQFHSCPNKCMSNIVQYASIINYTNVQHTKFPIILKKQLDKSPVQLFWQQAGPIIETIFQPFILAIILDLHHHLARCQIPLLPLRNQSNQKSIVITYVDDFRTCIKSSMLLSFRKWMVFQATILHCKAILFHYYKSCHRCRINWLLDMLICSPVCYHYAMTALMKFQE